MGRMGLALVVGPAKAGKIARLLEGYLGGDRARSGPDRAERGGRRPDRARPPAPGRRAARRARSGRSTTSSASSRLGWRIARPVAATRSGRWSSRRVLARTSLNGLGRSARFAGFADALLSALAELESGLVEPDQLDGDLGRLYAAYRDELDRLGLWDRDLLRRRAVERLRSGPRRLGRAAGLRLRLRGSDGRGVGAARGALGPRRR